MYSIEFVDIAGRSQVSGGDLVSCVLCTKGVALTFALAKLSYRYLLPNSF